MSAGPGADPAVSLRDVRFRFDPGAPPALDGVRLAVARGEVLGIGGRNGSGKTTLARIVAGLLRPQAGTVVVDGVETAGHGVRELASHVAFAFQNPGHQLFASTVRAELAFGPRNLGVAPVEVDARVGAVAAELGLEDVLDAHPRRLGLAQRKLVSIGSVVTMRTPVLVLDEPTTGQDHRTVAVLAGLLGRLRAAGTTVLVVAHDTAFLAEVAERLVVLDAGRVIGDAPPRAVFADASLMARARLVAPQVTRLWERLAAAGRTAGVPALTVPELVEALAPPGSAGSRERRG